MAAEIQAFLIRCQCGKELRVKASTASRSVACPACGQTLWIAFPTPVTMENKEGGNAAFSWKRPPLVWTIPACLLVLGLLFIINRELSDRRRQAVADAMPVKRAEPVHRELDRNDRQLASSRLPLDPAPAKQEIEEEDPEFDRSLEPVAPETVRPPRTPRHFTPPTTETERLFPGAEIHSVTGVGFSLPRGRIQYMGLWREKCNGEFEVRNGRIISPDLQFAAIRLQPIANNFELTMLGDFRPKGIMFYMLGWDDETASGYLLYNIALVTRREWFLVEILNGGVQGKPLLLDLQPAMQSRDSWIVEIRDKKLIFSYLNEKEKLPVLVNAPIELPHYQPGGIFFGTFPNRYGGRSVKIDEILFRHQE